LLAIVDAQLVAVLVRLDSPIHGERRGGWLVEAGFGPCSGPVQPAFDQLQEAQDWIAARVSRSA
jgi:hypothetical protein